MRYWVAMLMAVAARGQESGTATVRGRVVIQLTQEAVPATISIDGREARAGEDGVYRLEGAPVGKHLMKVRSPGFKSLDIEIELRAGEDAELPAAEVRIASMCGFPDEPVTRKYPS